MNTRKPISRLSQKVNNLLKFCQRSTCKSDNWLWRVLVSTTIKYIANHFEIFITRSLLISFSIFNSIVPKTNFLLSNSTYIPRRNVILDSWQRQRAVKIDAVMKTLVCLKFSENSLGIHLPWKPILNVRQDSMAFSNWHFSTHLIFFFITNSIFDRFFLSLPIWFSFSNVSFIYLPPTFSDPFYVSSPLTWKCAFHRSRQK